MTVIIFESYRYLSLLKIFLTSFLSTKERASENNGEIFVKKMFCKIDFTPRKFFHTNGNLKLKEKISKGKKMVDLYFKVYVPFALNLQGNFIISNLCLKSGRLKVPRQ